jgi:hypothetical protein
MIKMKPETFIACMAFVFVLLVFGALTYCGVHP